MKSKTVNKIGMWSGIICAILGLGYILPTLLSLLKIISFTGELIYFYVPSLFLAPVFMILMIALHYSATSNKRIYTALGLNFATIYCTLSTIAYFIPLTTLLSAYITNDLNFKPSLSLSSILNAANHLAYLFMSLSTFVAAYAFKNHKRLFQGLWANGVLAPLIILAYINPKLFYLETLWFISFPFLMATVALYFKNQSQGGKHQSKILKMLKEEYS